jgi:hypothetical protein
MVAGMILYIGIQQLPSYGLHRQAQAPIAEPWRRTTPPISRRPSGADSSLPVTPASSAKKGKQQQQRSRGDGHNLNVVFEEVEVGGDNGANDAAGLQQPNAEQPPEQPVNGDAKPNQKSPVDTIPPDSQNAQPSASPSRRNPLSALLQPQEEQGAGLEGAQTQQLGQQLLGLNQGAAASAVDSSENQGPSAPVPNLWNEQRAAARAQAEQQPSLQSIAKQLINAHASAVKLE